MWLSGGLSAQRLLDLLQQGGEAMSPAEVQHVFQVLTGADKPMDALPDAVDAAWFMSEVLGFQNPDDVISGGTIGGQADKAAVDVCV
jgi:hypothetical protein